MKNPLENHWPKLVILLAVCNLMICELVVVARGVGVCPVQSSDSLAEGNDRELVRRAVELAERGKPEEGIALLKKVIARSPNHLRARIQYVRIKTYYLSRYDEVRAEYDSLISRDPNNPVYTMSLAIGASRLIPGRTKNEWFEKASKMASEWPWGHYATARLISEKSPGQAASELIKCIEKDEGAIEAYAMLLSLQKNKLGKLDDAIATAEKMSRLPESRADGLFELWNLRLAKSGGAEQIKEALKKELDDLSSSRDAVTLRSIRDFYAETLHDRERLLSVENKIRQIDPQWYPERGRTFLLVINDGDGIPRQVALSGLQVRILFNAYFIGDDLEPKEKIVRLEQLLSEGPNADVKQYIYDRLLSAAEKKGDSSAVVKYGEALRAIDASGVAVLSKIALALADQKKDLTKALSYARKADEKTENFHSPQKPANTDPDWFKETITQDWQKTNYDEKRALSLEAHGWVLCQMGNYKEGESKLRDSLKLSRSEKKLLRLAEALRNLGRVEESEKLTIEAGNEYAESLKRRFSNEPAEDFQLETIEGRKVKLSELRGKAVMLYFLATWCAACSKEGPYLVKLYDKYKKLGFEILAISIDKGVDRHKLAPFAKELNFTFPVLFDEGVAQLYKVQELPMSMIFIDRQGRVRYRQMGFYDDTPRELDIVIQEILK